MPQYERKTGYVVKRPKHGLFCFVAEEFDPEAGTQFFAHKNTFRDREIPNVGAQVIGLIKPSVEPGMRDKMFDIEVVPMARTCAGDGEQKVVDKNVHKRTIEVQCQ